MIYNQIILIMFWFIKISYILWKRDSNDSYISMVVFDIWLDTKKSMWYAEFASLLIIVMYMLKCFLKLMKDIKIENK